MLKLITIVTCWMAGTAAFYAFACWFIYEYKRGQELRSSMILDVVRPKTLKNTVQTILLIAVVMTAVLSAMIGISHFFPHLFKNFGNGVVFFSFFALPYLFYRQRVKSGWAPLLLLFLGEFACAIAATWFWAAHPNWITNNIACLTTGMVILAAFSKATYRQCITIAVGVMLYDAVAVFASHQMQTFADAAGTRSAGMIVIPNGISLSQPDLLATGLGDLVTPGIIILFAYRVAKKRGATGAIAGYVAGMLVALVILIHFNFPQPATIYLMPGTFLGLWIATGRWKEFPEPVQTS